MAGVFDFLNPVDPQEYAQAQQNWNTFLDNPQGRAALLSAGLALMQPPSFGDTGASQIGRAIGAAGQSATANEATDMKKQELESKQDLRAAQAGAAEARAATAGARADTSAANLALKREQLDALNNRNLLQLRVRASNMYQQYVNDVNKRNVLATTPEPVMSFQDWMKNNPLLRNSGLMPDTEGGDETGAGMTPAPTAPTPMPASKNDLRAGVVYATPKGNLKWTGTGFVQP